MANDILSDPPALNPDASSANLRKLYKAHQEGRKAALSEAYEQLFPEH